MIAVRNIASTVRYQELSDLVPANTILPSERISDGYLHDESLTEPWHTPDVVVLPRSADHVAAVITWANRHHVPVVARGAGTGLAGGSICRRGGILLSMEKMNQIVDIDAGNRTAIVEAGVSLSALDDVLTPQGLVYPVYPGEPSATIGGNIATNAGGMHAVRYGVTRHNVTGLQAVLGTGQTIRTGGKFVKSASGYDLTQLLIGSEGTLGIVTEATLRLTVAPKVTTTLLAPFPTLKQTCAAATRLLREVTPSILEYIDRLSMAGITSAQSLRMPFSDQITNAADAYLLIVIEETTQTRAEESSERIGSLLADWDALDVYVLPSHHAVKLIRARERAFFAAKANGARDILDIVVPRTRIAELLDCARAIGIAHDAPVVGCGHVGDGNVHISVFAPDDKSADAVARKIYDVGASLGGAVSGEHGIGTAKQHYFLAHADPAAIELQTAVKGVFDPNGILNPGVLFGDSGSPPA